MKKQIDKQSNDQNAPLPSAVRQMSSFLDGFERDNDIPTLDFMLKSVKELDAVNKASQRLKNTQIDAIVTKTLESINKATVVPNNPLGLLSFSLFKNYWQSKVSEQVEKTIEIIPANMLLDTSDIQLKSIETGVFKLYGLRELLQNVNMAVFKRIINQQSYLLDGESEGMDIKMGFSVSGPLIFRSTLIPNAEIFKDEVIHTCHLIIKSNDIDAALHYQVNFIIREVYMLSGDKKKHFFRGFYVEKSGELNDPIKFSMEEIYTNEENFKHLLSTWIRENRRIYTLFNILEKDNQYVQSEKITLNFITVKREYVLLYESTSTGDKLLYGDVELASVLKGIFLDYDLLKAYLYHFIKQNEPIRQNEAYKSYLESACLSFYRAYFYQRPLEMVSKSLGILIHDPSKTLFEMVTKTLRNDLFHILGIRKILKKTITLLSNYFVHQNNIYYENSVVFIEQLKPKLEELMVISISHPDLLNYLNIISELKETIEGGLANAIYIERTYKALRHLKLVLDFSTTNSLQFWFSSFTDLNSFVLLSLKVHKKETKDVYTLTKHRVKQYEERGIKIAKLVSYLRSSSKTDLSDEVANKMLIAFYLRKTNVVSSLEKAFFELYFDIHRKEPVLWLNNYIQNQNRLHNINNSAYASKIQDICNRSIAKIPIHFFQLNSGFFDHYKTFINEEYFLISLIPALDLLDYETLYLALNAIQKIQYKADYIFAFRIIPSLDYNLLFNNLSFGQMKRTFNLHLDVFIENKEVEPAMRSFTKYVISLLNKFSFEDKNMEFLGLFMTTMTKQSLVKLESQIFDTDEEDKLENKIYKSVAKGGLLVFFISLSPTVSLRICPRVQIVSKDGVISPNQVPAAEKYFRFFFEEQESIYYNIAFQATKAKILGLIEQQIETTILNGNLVENLKLQIVKEIFQPRNKMKLKASFKKYYYDIDSIVTLVREVEELKISTWGLGSRDSYVTQDFNTYSSKTAKLLEVVDDIVKNISAIEASGVWVDVINRLIRCRVGFIEMAHNIDDVLLLKKRFQKIYRLFESVIDQLTQMSNMICELTKKQDGIEQDEENIIYNI